MFNKFISPVLMILGILLFACAGRQTQPTTAGVIDLSGIWDKPEEILLSFIATDIEYIPLETTTDCLLGEPQNLRFTVLDNHIAVSSKGLRLFDRQGKYLRTIGRIGKGPQEYFSSGEYVIDEKNGRVDILDSDRDRVVSYRITGEFIRDIRIADHAAIITRDESGRIGVMYLPWDQDIKDTARFEWINEEGKLIKSIPLYVGRPKDGGDTWLIAARLYWNQKKLVFAEWPFDTLHYLADDHAWKPLWIPKIGSNKMPREVGLNLDRWEAERNDFTSVMINSESSRYLFFEGEKKEKFGIVIYDKMTLAGHWMPGMITEDSLNMETVVNDLDGGIPMRSTILTGAQGDYYVSLLSPFELIAKFKNHPKSELPLVRPELREKLFKLVDRLREDDNPVLMIVKLKTKNE
ncbi:MAG: 6-bladed beta-propeller [Porphyromonadaceae bacterium]|nr:MAG: 6-bladed beta-propeller [Porphyromonadaceae bacterium]